MLSVRSSHRPAVHRAQPAPAGGSRPPPVPRFPSTPCRGRPASWGTTRAMNPPRARPEPASMFKGPRSAHLQDTVRKEGETGPVSRRGPSRRALPPQDLGLPPAPRATKTRDARGGRCRRLLAAPFQAPPPRRQPPLIGPADPLQPPARHARLARPFSGPAGLICMGNQKNRLTATKPPSRSRLLFRKWCPAGPPRPADSSHLVLSAARRP